ncbi:MAG: hypothetical protein BGO38_06975 [Cellulomonas sp. 73-145]|uniref:hypothetical protein n=1 Tax=Cellulomonas sp. 73-145 TaxID=1895739 RepID=UPI0009263875|nr:hypothetical protein [Cellulomonas sp. 73-145]MBN9327982.1 hypothetical protein [Cellulomonas sp.]OJV57959.1 MAG: hypothetical protein BGO38_06975 [Cellulomonas sp. 73-145]
MDQLLSGLLSQGGAATAIALVLLIKVLVGDRRTDRRMSDYTRSLERRLELLEAWKQDATSAMVSAGVPLPRLVSVPAPSARTDWS